MTPSNPPDRESAAGEEPASESLRFEEALDRLGALVARLESGGLGLAESIAAYEQGVTLLRRLHEELDEAEERVRVLVRIDEDGRPVLADRAPPDEPAAAATPRRSRGRARTSRSRSLPGMDEASEGA